MSTRVAVLAVAALLLFALAAPGSATTKFNCSSGGKVWSITPGMWPIDLTIMTAKSATDCDLMVDDGAGTILGLGMSIESGYESIRFGPLPGLSLRITALKASGPNSKTYLRGSDSLRFMSGGPGVELRALGSAQGLASRDPDYARALEIFKSYQRLKAGSAGLQ